MAPEEASGWLLRCFWRTGVLYHVTSTERAWQVEMDVRWSFIFHLWEPLSDMNFNLDVRSPSMILSPAVWFLPTCQTSGRHPRLMRGLTVKTQGEDPGRMPRSDMILMI